MRPWSIGSRTAKIAALGTGLALAGIAAPLTADAAPRTGGCPSSAQIVQRFGYGTAALVREGSLSQTEAKEASRRFARWVLTEAPEDLGCTIRENMFENAQEVLGLLGLTPLEVRQAFRDGQSMAEMAEANDRDRGELVEILNGMVGDGLATLEETGAIDAEVAAAFADLAAERIAFAVDFEKGDPLPGWHAGKHR